MSIAKSEFKAFWNNHFEAWSNSGLTRQAYCERHSINYSTFVYQRILLSIKNHHTSKFIEATATASNINRSLSINIQIILSNGIKVGISNEASMTTLQQILTMVGNI